MSQSSVRSVWVVASIALVAVVGAGVFFLRHRQPAPPPPAKSAPAAPAPTFLTLNGKIRAAHITGAGSDAMGTIAAFMAGVGDEVSEGQVLAEIGSTGLESERADAAAAVEKAQNRVDEALKIVSAAQLDGSRANADAERARAELDRVSKLYDRQKTLFAAGATPRLTYEKAARELESAQQQFDAVDKAARGAAGRVQDTLKDLDYARRTLTDKGQQLAAVQNELASAVVVSPVDGLVVARQGAVGDPVQQFGNDLFSIGTDLYDLEVAVEARPEVLRRLHPGAPALVIIPDMQNTGLPGTVITIHDNQAVIGFENPNPALRPGMPAEVRLKPE